MCCGESSKLCYDATLKPCQSNTHIPSNSIVISLFTTRPTSCVRASEDKQYTMLQIMQRWFLTVQEHNANINTTVRQRDDGKATTAKQQQHDNNRALTPDKHAAKYGRHCIVVSYWLIELQRFCSLMM